MVILIKLFLNNNFDFIRTVKFVKQLFRIQIQKFRKVLLWNQVKSRMEACYSELVLASLMYWYIHFFPCQSGLGQKSTVLCPNGPSTSLNWFNKVESISLLTVLIYILFSLASIFKSAKRVPFCGFLLNFAAQDTIGDKSFLKQHLTFVQQ